MKITVDEILDLMAQVDLESPIDWGLLAIDDQQACRLIALDLVEQYNSSWSLLEPDDQIRSLLAAMAHLVVENFALNLQRLQQ